MDYVVSDIHGEFQKFLKLIDVINLKKEDKLYILGDVIDRGNEPIALLNFIMANDNMVLLKGNHEDMMVEWALYADMGMFQCWIQNGGGVTHKQFLNLPSNKKWDLIDYLESRPLYKTINNFILSHAGFHMIPVDCDMDTILKAQKPNDFLWSRDEFYNYPVAKEYMCIFGHTPTKFIQQDRKEKVTSPMKIWHDNLHKDKICIDCGVNYRDGQMSCLRLDDMTEYYIN